MKPSEQKKERVDEFKIINKLNLIEELVYMMLIIIVLIIGLVLGVLYILYN